MKPATVERVGVLAGEKQVARRQTDATFPFGEVARGVLDPRVLLDTARATRPRTRQPM